VVIGYEPAAADFGFLLNRLLRKYGGFEHIGRRTEGKNAYWGIVWGIGINRIKFTVIL